MATDIKLDQQGGNWVLIEASVLKCTGADFMLDSPGRRGAGGSPHRRALVHDAGDALTINFARDYSGGVNVIGDLAVTGDVRVGGQALGGAVRAMSSRIAELEQTIASLTQLIGAVFIPPWRTRTEVEEGDDMVLVVLPASSLGLIVEYEIDQLNPAFGHEDVISIDPPAGTAVLRGSTVRVRINLEG
ncbi:MAG: PASTA domain-containing protein [Micropruina sp.]|nr:PASTA domain-containing protein [Micropruina sp.]